MLKKLQIYTGISDIALINDMLRNNRVQVGNYTQNALAKKLVKE